MPPTVVLIRHAQAEHNVMCDWSIPDPHLTALGKSQAKAIPTTYPSLFDNVDIILSSPMRRTIETTLLGFPKLKDGSVKLELLPDLQETAAHPCDTGSSREFLQNEFKDFAWVDFSNCIDGWNDKKGKYAPTPEALQKRALEVRRHLKSRTEGTVLVVCHAGFLRHLLLLPHEHFWANVEARVFRFQDDSNESIDNGYDPPPKTDQALLQRLPEEEEINVLGRPSADAKKDLEGEKDPHSAPQH
ncbi:PGAM-domain-containing protein [Cystobasidium minutum MCA 4210]|uniref:PGAM-domain-containing protein n=1 Tax=Cystobasidium minutum MCA 4210 TaxID=1397322 RepID=UPI0034CF98FB|eukprot:jgi/Rhomi1/173932/fgenesh1_kg.6_\